MRCPHCGTVEDKVVESRTLANGDAVRRRRECNNCGYRFTSYERIDEIQFMVVKRDGRREPFDRLKLERGVIRALEKRPFSQMQIENLVNEIEDETAISSKGSREISSSVIGDLVLERLGKLDKVAYIRFASVYKQFKDLEEFIEEIKKVGV
ncbi:MAG: transcriptional regulator NrdR [Treponema sp.]|jgi:transcriptional repressor NrdR|nr:transcriptional regulator NrdR [Treponema sp.]